MAVDKRESIEHVDIVLDLSRVCAIPDSTEVKANQDFGPGTKFQFCLCRKQEQFGELAFDQWWMPRQGLYGERGKESLNRQAVIDCFWSLCLGAGSALSDRGVQESYILASLLPHARSNGSRDVFVDASLTRRKGDEELDRGRMLAWLEKMLSDARQDEVGVLEFNRRTADFLGPPEYEEQVVSCYEEIAEEILQTTCDDISRSGVAALETSIRRWTDKMKRFGRRSGYKTEKDALDILSYECRAAFHRCYSATWLALLDQLAVEYNLSEETVLFHRLWHLDQCLQAEEAADEYFHLFHGHILGLHPAAGDLVCTPTGCQLVGELIASPGDIASHQRFLNGLLIAVGDYSRRYNVCKELRKGASRVRFQNDYETIQGDQLLRQQGRRPGGRRGTDAR